jgi:hypothetical protein
MLPKIEEHKSMRTFTKDEHISRFKDRYLYATRGARQVILDEICQMFKYHRKYAIRLLNVKEQALNKPKPAKRGRKPLYDDPTILEVLTDIWQKTNLPCAKRLKAILPLWLPFYDKFIIPDDIIEKLHKISPATIDRLMAPDRAKCNKIGLATTKPGSIIKKHIPIKTNQWDERIPGFLEADTVAHCGNSMAGMFVFTLNCVDLATGWVEQRAVWGKGETGVKDAMESIESALPFPILGFDCDNGSEFLNWHLIKFFTDRKRPVGFTRSRPYHKNDNAHIENKNWTNVRLYLGYERFDDARLVHLLNDLYQNEWTDYFNFFIPSVKLIEKKRVGSKIKKIHDGACTPYHRLTNSIHTDPRLKEQLKAKLKTLNPFEIQSKMMVKIKAIMKIVNEKNNMIVSIINTPHGNILL